MTETRSTSQSDEQSTRKPPRPCIPAWVREILRTLKGAPLAVLVAYWSRANRDGFAWPSIETLSRDTGYRELAVKRAKKVLIGIGLLVPVQHHRDADGRYKKKVFRVCTEVSKAYHGTAVCFSNSTAVCFSHPTVVSKAYQEGSPVEGNPNEGRREAAASSPYSVLEGGGSPLQTTPKEKPSRELEGEEAWTAIGIKAHGPQRYQDAWVRKHREKSPFAKLSDVMEQFIQDCGRQRIKIPHAFYEAKHAIEVKENRGRPIMGLSGSDGGGKFDDIPCY